VSDITLAIFAEQNKEPRGRGLFFFACSIVKVPHARSLAQECKFVVRIAKEEAFA
jgi:hypothetical protein